MKNLNHLLKLDRMKFSKQVFNGYYLWAILLFSIVMRLGYFFRQNTVWWDGAVYLQMGKYIYSYGSFGLWEPIRPIVWPLINGFFWRFTSNQILYSRIFIFIISIAVIYLTYRIALIFGRKTALIAAILLSFTPIFFLYTFRLYTEILSLFFVLLGILVFVESRESFAACFVAGLLISLSFLTRFPQILVLVGLLIFILLFEKNEKIKKTLTLLSGFLVILAGYLIFNFIVYRDGLFPLFEAFDVIQYSGIWIHEAPWGYYIVGLVKENFVFLFLVLPLFYVFKRGIIIDARDKRNMALVAGIFLVILVFLSYLEHKELRYLIILLPYVAILSSYSLTTVVKNKTILTFILVIFLTVSFIKIEGIFDAQTKNLYNKETERDFYEFVDQGRELEHRHVLSTSPRIGLDSDVRISQIYYLKDSYIYDNVDEILSEKYDYILINTCDIPCDPNKPTCEMAREKLLIEIDKIREVLYNKKIANCEYKIYT